MRFFSGFKSICRTVIFVGAVVLFQKADAQVTVTGSVGADGTYSNIRNAFANINLSGPQTGATIVVTVTASTFEGSNPCTLQDGGWNSLTVQPGAVNMPLTISGPTNPGSALIDFNGADHVTINGLNADGSRLIFSNTTVSSVSNTSTIRFSNGATNNTITNCKIQGSSSSATGTITATVLFADDAVTANGNDNNAISNNDIGPANVTVPARAIASSGSTSTTAIANSGNLISGNNIFDYFSVSNVSDGVFLDAGTTDWTIQNNRFYQTATRSMSGSPAFHSAIHFASASINNCLVSGNIIGYAAAAGTGTYTINGGTGGRFCPVYGQLGTTVGTIIQNNTISAIAFSGNISGITTSSPFMGIYLTAGAVTITGNTIGSTTVNASILVTTSSSSALEADGLFVTSVAGIYSNNSIGGITLNTSAFTTLNFTGMHLMSGNGFTNTAQNNTIGFSAAPIYTNSQAASRMIGIYSQSGAGNFTGNTIAYLNTISSNTGTGSSSSLLGMLCDHTSATLPSTISGNTIYALVNSNTMALPSVIGIYYSGNPAVSGSVVSQNFIHSLRNWTNNSSTSMCGLWVADGQTTFSNNMIRLGIDASGAVISTPSTMYGIRELNGTNQFYFNSVFIGGSASGTSNTYALNSSNTGTRTYLDNIFYNARSNSSGAGKHYAIAVAGTAVNPAGLVSNYNDLFASGTAGVIGFFNSADCSTPAAWTTATGQDVNSQNSNPLFVDPAGNSAAVDLHITGAAQTWIESTGIPVSGITTDFDGQTRAAFSPTDIGADAGNFLAFVPVLGIYPNTTVIAGQNAVVTPSAAPLNALTMSVYSTTNLGGVLTVNPTTGVVRLTDVRQAGTYTVTVKATGTYGTATTTFVLTVSNPNCSDGFLTGTSNLSVPSGPQGIAVGDFNTDGIQDLAITTNTTSTIAIFLGNGAGGFVGGGSLTGIGTNPRYVAVGDFNGDGKQDLVNSAVNSAALFISLGDGLGGFAAATSVTVASFPTGVTVGDFNNDGYSDIVSGTSANTASIRLGNGSGGFTVMPDVVTLSANWDIEVGDFNEDGKQDLAITSNNGVSVRLGDGAGNFSGSTFVSAGTGCNNLAIADFNHDGHQDLAVSNISSGTVSIRLGDGLGGFSGTTDVVIGSQVTFVAVGDFNGDGNSDLVVSRGNGPISIKLGDGLGNFTGTFTITSGNLTRQIVLGDFNSDGYNDIVATNDSGNNASIRLGGAADIQVSGNLVTITDGDVTPSTADYTDFGTACSGSITKTFTITNTGQFNLSIGGLTITGTNAAEFAVTTMPATTLTPGNSSNFQVTFTPSAAGFRNATLTIANSDCDEGSYDFAIRGTGSTPVTGITVVTNVACSGGSNGAINLTPTGGTAGYTFNWLPSGPTTEDRTGLTAGTYSVQITDANGCTGTVTATVTQPTSPVSGTTVVTNVTCNGGSNGAINLTPTGGTPGYTFNWLSSGPTTEDRTGLSAGTYSVLITDANGCTGTVTTTVTQSTAISVTASAQTNVSCSGGNNGAASINPAFGGGGGYTYNWTPGNPTGDGTISVTGLTAGTWTVTTTDANGCTATNSFSITEPSPISVTASSQTNISCFGGNNGAASINAASGGAGGFTYNWTPGNPSGDGTTSVSGLTAGVWTVTTTDANGCTASNSFTVTEPSPISVTASAQTNISCFGGNNGAASINPASGGAGGYTYNWTPGNPSGDGTTSVTGLTAGVWTVTTTDANGCTSSNSFTVTEPSPISVTASAQTNVSCFGGNNGAASINPANGGAGGFTYDWTPGNPSGDGTRSVTGLTAGAWTVTATDANGCTAAVTFNVTEPLTALASTSSATSILCHGGSANVTVTASGGTSPYNGQGTFTETAGTYSFMVTDNNGCTSTTSVTITEPTVLTSAITSTSILCNGGNATVTVTASGGTSPYNGDGSFTETAGTYFYTVADANGCASTSSVTITEPTVLTSTATSTSVLCNGGNATVTVTASGGTSPYTGDGTFTETAGTYSYTVTDNNGCTSTSSVTITEPAVLTSAATSTSVLCNGGNATVTVVASGGTSPYTGDGTFTETAGNYSYTVTDNNGCTSTSSVTITEPAVLISAATSTSVLCNGGNATVTVAASGGTSPYTGDGTFTETAGNYSYTVTDANACTSTSSVTITEPAVLASTATSTSVLCNGENATVTVAASGGTSPYTGDGTFTETAGTYSYTVTDANACTSTSSVTITEPAVLAVSVNATVNPSTCNGTDGSVDIDVTGGTTAYSFLWNNNDTNEDLTAIAAGSYSVTVTDANGCTAVASAGISDPAAPAVALALPIDTACGTFPGLINLSGESPAGGTWSGNTVSGNTFDPYTAGMGVQYITYTFTDANGCTASATDSLLVDPCLGIETVSATQQWDLFPNPTNAELTITTSGEITTDVLVDIYSADGKLIKRENEQQVKTITLDMSAQPVGVYFIRITANDKVSMHRVVKI